jgi:hypothetical protein
VGEHECTIALPTAGEQGNRQQTQPEGTTAGGPKCAHHVDAGKPDQTWAQSPLSTSLFGTAFTFVLSWDPQQWCLVPILACSHTLLVLHLLLHLVGILGPTLPSLAHSWHCICFCTQSGSWWWSIPTLTLPHALLAPCLLGQDPWWWCHVPACLLPHTPSTAVPTCSLLHTPGTVFTFMLGRDPWWWCLVPAHLLPAPCLLSCSV